MTLPREFGVALKVAVRSRRIVFAHRLLLALAFLYAIPVTTVSAQPVEDVNPLAKGGSELADIFEPAANPSVAIRAALEPVRVDGELDDAAWREASWVSNFSEMWPGDRSKPLIDMKAGITYDDENLYVAFKVFDDPDRVRTTLTDRDKMWRDDFVAVLLDTYQDGGWAYFLASNPIGIQGDSRIITGAEEEDESFDIIYSSQGKITEAGYQVEMAIPFRSLRFPTGPDQRWKANFQVTHPRDTRRVYTWSAVDRNDACTICQYGTITGISNVSPGAGYELLPALVGSQSATLSDEDNPFSGINNGRVEIEPSLGIKYAFNSNVIGDFTLNPDFSQVESDAAQIDVNESFALFFPEKRPFFQEGSDLYQTPIQTVYTRSINNPGAAAKMTSRFDRTNVGYIGASDSDSPVIIPLDESSEFVSAGRSFSNVARIKRSFDGGANIGAQLTDRRFEGGGSGSTVGLDGQVRLRKDLQISWQFVASHTEEPNDPSITEEIDDVETLTFNHGQRTVAFDGEKFSGHAASVSLSRSTRAWSFQADYQATSPTFRADNGFVTQNNRQRFTTWQNYSVWFEDSFFKQIRPHTWVAYELDFDGNRRLFSQWLGALIRVKGQTEFMIGRNLYKNEIFKGIDYRGTRRTWMRLQSGLFEAFQIEAEWSFGDEIAKGEDVPELGRSINADVSLTFKPMSQMIIEPVLAYSRLRGKRSGETIFDGYILRVRSDYQATRRLIVRVVTQYNKFDDRLEVDPLVTYRLNPFTAVFVGSTHDYSDFDDYNGGFKPTDRQFFFKLQYLVRS